METQTFTHKNLIAGNQADLVTKDATVLQDSRETPEAYPAGLIMGQITDTGKYAPCISTAEDGSQVACAVLLNECDATAADAGGILVIKGELNVNKLSVIDEGDAVADFTHQLELVGIIARNSVAA